MALSLIAIASFTACDTSEGDPNPAPAADGISKRARTGTATVTDGAVEVPYVQGRRVFNPAEGGFERLGGQAHAPFTTTLSPAGVFDPVTKTLLAYDSWHRGAPAIRIHDLESGDDFVTAEGAFSVAWSAKGELAYFKGLDRRVRESSAYRGHVLVRSSSDSPPTRWSRRPGRYVVAAWAGDRLVAYRHRRGSTDILVFDGPGRMRVLAREAALVALSPEGSRAFIADNPDPRPIVRVVALQNGEERARLSLAGEREPTTRRRLSYVGYSGSWTNDLVVAAVSGGIGVFRIQGNTIRVEQLLGLNPDMFPIGVTEPRGDDSGRYIVASVELAPSPGGALGQTALIECDRLRLACELGRLANYVQPPRVVHNPSRP